MNSSPDRLDSTVDPKLLEILVCPVTKGPLEFDAARQELISRSAKLAYPIRDGIPIMLPEEAQPVVAVICIRRDDEVTGPRPSTAAALRQIALRPDG